MYTFSFISKTLIVSLLIGGMFCDITRASDGKYAEIVVIFGNIVGFFSWAWIFFAFLAGKLMSNDFVYGSVIHLDVYLWQIRNMIKNFANYTLGFFFLYQIIMVFFSPDSGPNEVRKSIPQYLLAGVLIQMSRFLVGAVLDIVTIMTSAVGAFPGMFLSDNQEMQDTIVYAVSKVPHQYICEQTTATQASSLSAFTCQTSFTGRNVTDKELFDFLSPQYNSVSGPLVFMGASMLKLMNFGFKQITADSLRTVALTTILQFAVIILYTIMVIGLFIVNLVRIFYLWMLICFTPFIILFSVVEKPNMGSLLGKFTIKSFFSLLFFPVVATAAMSIGLVFVIGMYNVMSIGGTETISFQGATIGFDTVDQVSHINVPEMADISIRGTFYESLDGDPQTSFNFGFVGDIIMMSLTLFILWTVLTLTFGLAGELGEFGKNIVDSSLSVMKSVPLIPGVKGSSLNNIERKLDQTIGGGFLREQSAKFSDQSAQQLQDLFGGTMPMGYSDKLQLEKLLKENKRSEFKNKIQSIRETKSVTFADLQPFLEQYYQNHPNSSNFNIPKSSDNKVNRSAIVTNNEWKSRIQTDFGISSSDIDKPEQWNSKNIGKQ